jgi:crotonobetainyl-CoA:carnitine CoA-transferase CaiB-like acyl-CoA transferase
MFPAADGFVTIAAHQQQFFSVLCRAIEAEALVQDARFCDDKARSIHRVDLNRELGEFTRRFTKAELMARLGGQIPFGPVMNIAEIAADPHFAARDMLPEVEQPGSAPIRIAGVPIKMTVTPGAVRRRAPFLGEQTRTQLRRAGLTDDAIQTLVDAGAAIAHDT